MSVTELLPSHSKKTDSGEPYVVWNEYYQAYKNWCVANGEKPESITKFTRESAKVIPEFHKRLINRKIDGKVVRVLMGAGARFPSGDAAG